MTDDLDRIIHGDCIQELAKLNAGSVDLVFADPPFNIGYEYDECNDARSPQSYLAWSREWIIGAVDALKPNGTLWVAIGDDYAAELKVMIQKLGLTCRNWVIWHYTFGVNCKRKFTRSHTHLLYFVKDPKNFTFNADAIRVPSARQLKYNDKRANPKGRIPDDTWQFPRVCGTFKERAGFHGCQMPEQVLGRIIRACSNEGDLVLDPFVGSGTTLAVAKKLRRRYLGIELSEKYVAGAEDRLYGIEPGEYLCGALADPPGLV
jgi:site-specific DNA-methyltransferase (adenine-specific)